MTDIALVDMDLLLVDGDFLVSESTAQHQSLLLSTNKGEWKQHPTRGVGIVNYIETANPSELAREIRTEFSADGMTVKKLNINGSKVEVEAHYG